MQRSLALALSSLGLATLGVLWRARRRPAPPRPEHISESEQAFLQARTRVVVLGAGFGGLAAALSLDRLIGDQAGVSVLVIDRNNRTLFNPLLWTVADGRTSPDDVVVPIRDLQRGRRFHVLQAEVQGIDLNRREVHLDAGVRPYDYLVIALGSITSLPPVPGVERALPFRSPGDALSLRDHLIDAVEAAHRATTEAERSAWLTFIVTGGGDTGVELAGAIQSYLARGLLKEYPWLAQGGGQPAFRVVIVGRQPRLVPMGETSESEATQRILEQQGIEVHTVTAVEAIRPGVVVTSRGEIPAHTIFWAAGIAPSPVLRDLPVEHNKGGVLAVDDHLRLPEHPEVYVVGDAGWIYDAEGKPLPPTAQAAEHAGDYAGKAIAAAMRGDAAPEAFRFRPLGHLSLLGPGQALGTIGPLHVAGRLAWLLWHAYYLYRMPSLKRQVSLVVSWLLAWVFGREVAEMRVTPAPPDRPAVPSQPGHAPAASAASPSQWAP
jgi:NADH dehydrogenase